MRSRTGWVLVAMWALGTSCSVDVDHRGGEVQRESKSVELGKAEMVRAIVRIGAGEIRVSGGAAKLLEADFVSSYGMPEVKYKETGARGTLEIGDPGQRKFRIGSGGEHTWTLKLNNDTPLDLELHLGAGESGLDLSRLNLRSLEVHMGVGELKLNLDGEYRRDVDVEVQGGVGRAEIRLPRRIGAQVDAKGGIGSLNVRGLKKDGGMYVNAAFEKSTRQVRCKVRGGIGEIDLIGDE